jgi:hypothetical protein
MWDFLKDNILVVVSYTNELPVHINLVSLLRVSQFHSLDFQNLQRKKLQPAYPKQGQFLQ